MHPHFSPIVPQLQLCHSTLPIIITRLHSNLHTYYYLQSSTFRTFTNSGLIWLGNAPLLAVSALLFVSPRFVSARFLFTSYLSFGLSCRLLSFSLLIYLNCMYSSLPVHQHLVFFRSLSLPRFPPPRTSSFCFVLVSWNIIYSRLMPSSIYSLGWVLPGFYFSSTGKTNMRLTVNSTIGVQDKEIRVRV